MASNARTPEHGAAHSFYQPLRDLRMRAGYVLVSEERESGSEYSGSTCCCCSSCELSCSCEEYSEDDDEDDDEEEEDGDDDDEVVIEEEEEEGYWSDCSACWARRIIGRMGITGRTHGNRYVNIPRTVEERDVSGLYPAPAFSLSLSLSLFSVLFFDYQFRIRLTESHANVNHLVSPRLSPSQPA